MKIEKDIIVLAIILLFFYFYSELLYSLSYNPIGRLILILFIAFFTYRHIILGMLMLIAVLSIFFHTSYQSNIKSIKRFPKDKINNDSVIHSGNDILSNYNLIKPPIGIM